MDVAPHRNASKVSSARQMHFSNIRPMKRPCAIAGKGIFSAGCSFEAIPAPDAQQTSWFQRFEADAPEMLWLADPRRTNRLSALSQRFSAFQNTELSNSLSPPAEPGVYQCNYRPVSDDFGRYPVRLSWRDSSQLYTPRYLSQYCAELNSTGQERNWEEFAHIVPFNRPASGGGDAPDGLDASTGAKRCLASLQTFNARASRAVLAGRSFWRTAGPSPFFKRALSLQYRNAYNFHLIIWKCRRA